MSYQVSRNGQLYGPYTLEDLQRYIATGNVLPTDLATDVSNPEAAPNWIPVAQLLAASGAAIPTPPAPSYPVYATPHPGSTIPFPDPPNLHWLLDLLFWFLTCSIFNKVYILVQAAWVHKVQPSSKALILYIVATIVTVINIFTGFSIVVVLMSHPGVIPDRNPVNSFVGLVRVSAHDLGLSDFEIVLERVQHELFNLGSVLATLPDDLHPKQPRITPETIARLEQDIDLYNANLPPLRSFVLPGGSRISAELHVCRTVCRRAERLLVTLSREEDVPREALLYLNRLSDAAFVWSRWVNRTLGVEEALWQPNQAAR